MAPDRSAGLPVLQAAVSLLAVWGALAAAGLARPLVGADGALALGLAASAPALVATRDRNAPGRREPRALAFGGGLVTGLLGYPACWTACLAVVTAAGIAPGPPAAPGAASPLLAAATVLAAPLVEETLYRGRVLAALRRPLGAPGAVVVSSALFAFPHLEPRLVAATFAVGLGLGGVRAAGAPLALCVGIHSGLNLAAVVAGAPPSLRVLLAPSRSALAAFGVLAATALALRAARHRLAWRNRLGSLAVAAAGVVAAHALVPAGAARARGLYIAVATVGYGHLLGAARIGRRRGARRRRLLPLVLGAASTATLLAAWVWLLERAPALALGPLLVLSAWHTTENDLALDAAYAGGLRMPGLPRTPGRQAVVLVATAVLCTVFALTDGAGEVLPGLQASPRPGGPPFADVFALFGFYHLASWGLLLGDRRRSLAAAGRRVAARQLVRRVAAVHAVAAVPCAAALLLPGAGAAVARAWLFAPGLYLFWSALHVLQTAAARGVRPE
jgi:membrane protease YdiL (CAAX protease family)